MKNITSALILLFSFAALNAQVNFRQVKSAEDMEKVWSDASGQQIPVFIDIYATWCGPCKWLDANVFSREDAGEYMNRMFINVKMDGESEFGRIFAMKSGLSAYPSLFLFNMEQKQMNMIVGAMPWEELQPELASTLEYFPVLEIMQNKFEANLLQREEYPRFMKALRKMGKDDYATGVAAMYLKQFIDSEGRTADDIRVLAFHTRQDTEYWPLLIKDIRLLRDALGDDLEDFANQALTDAIKLSVEDHDPSCLERLNAVLPEIVEGTSLNADAMKTRSSIYYYHYSDLFEELIRYVDNEYETHRKGNDRWLFEAASDAVFLDPRNTRMAGKGVEWFSKCAEINETQEYYYYLALCQYYSGSPEGSVVSLKKSLEFTDDPEILKTTRSVIKQVEDELSE